jgi:enoyl-[acyl-carrier protein] reductase III
VIDPDPRSEMLLDGPPTTLITGGTKGIGRAIALNFAAPGRTMILNYHRDDATAHETRAAVEELGAEVLLVRGDVADSGVRREITAVVAEHAGSLGQLIHCAVRSLSTSFAQLDEDELERAIMTNGASLPLLAHTLRETFTRGTSIVFLTSVGARLAISDYLALGAPKAMAESFVRYLAVELAPHGVRANSLSCSSLLTEAFSAAIPDAARWHEKLAHRNPTGRNVTFEEVAGAARFLCSTQARMVNGTELAVDGGIYSRL